MDKIFSVLSNPFVWGAIIFILGFLFNKRLNACLKLLYLLIEAVEVVDEEIKDVVDDATRQKLVKIKFWIDARVKKDERKILDNALQNKGYLKKSENYL